MQEWFKIKSMTGYCGASERTCRSWIKNGLRFVRLPSGMLLVKREWIDAYLMGFEHRENAVEKIVSEVMEDLKE